MTIDQLIEALKAVRDIDRLIRLLDSCELAAGELEKRFPDSGEVEYVVKYLPDMISGLRDLRESETTNFN